MPLSEHEQRILDEIERRLAEEDPKFARSTTVAAPDDVARSRLRRGIAGFVVGLILLVAGLVTALDDANLLVVFGLAAFVVMLTSVLLIARAVRDLGPKRSTRDGWLRAMEKRWREKFDDGRDEQR